MNVYSKSTAGSLTAGSVANRVLRNVRWEVLSPGCIDQFRDVRLVHLLPVISGEDCDTVLAEFKRPRTTDETIYMRNGSVNRINGIKRQTAERYSLQATRPFSERSVPDARSTNATTYL